MALDLNALLNQIDVSLGASVSASTKNSQALNDLYEAFLFGLILDAARNIDNNAIAWGNLVGPNHDEVRLRGSPGEIYSADFSFATISFGGAAIFELHQGVRVNGVSGVAHECDVSVMHAGRAAWRRSQQTRPVAVDLFLALEAKAYDTTLVDLATGRNVVGLRADLQQQRIIFGAATSIEPSAEGLMSSWIAEAFADLMPNTPVAQSFVLHIEAILRS